MHWLVQCLLCRCKDMNLIPRTLVKIKLGIGACACNVILALGKQRQEDP